MKKSTRWTGVFVTLLVTVALALTPAIAGESDHNEEMLKNWQAAMNAGDAKAIAAMYTEDALRMPYQAPAVQGREAIAKNIQETLDQGITSVELTHGGSETHGKMGWAHGTYKLMTADGALAQEGKWMNVTKKVGGKWYIQADIWNTDAPE